MNNEVIIFYCVMDKSKASVVKLPEGAHVQLFETKDFARFVDEKQARVLAGFIANGVHALAKKLFPVRDQLLNAQKSVQP